MPERLSETLMSALWARMAAIFGHSWTGAYGVSPSGIAAETWSAGLGGINGEQIAHALRAVLAKGSEYPPSLPSFKALCYGLPSLGMTRRIIAAREQLTPFAYLVYQQLDAHRFRLADQATADRLLRDAYELAKELVMTGHPLPTDTPAQLPGATQAALEPPPRKKATPSVARKALDDMRDSISMPPLPVSGDEE